MYVEEEALTMEQARVESSDFDSDYSDYYYEMSCEKEAVHDALKVQEEEEEEHKNGGPEEVRKVGWHTKGPHPPEAAEAHNLHIEGVLELLKNEGD